MDKKLNIEKVESALKRAARAAVTGSKEVRAGRLVVRDSETGRFIDKADRLKNSAHQKSK